MPFIPYYLDGYVEAVILVLWAIIGVVAIVKGRKRLLPPPLLKRRATIAVVGAFVSMVFYTLYILQRQVVEAHNHITFGRALPKP
jgi:hypothetical protein